MRALLLACTLFGLIAVGCGASRATRRDGGASCSPCRTAPAGCSYSLDDETCACTLTCSSDNGGIDSGVCNPSCPVAPTGCMYRRPPGECSCGTIVCNDAAVSLDDAGPQGLPCTESVECPAAEYCWIGTSTCGSSGVCRPRPTDCSGATGEVCGCDGQSYTSACAANQVGVSVDPSGTCTPTPTGCTSNAECGLGSYCDQSAGCGTPGSCQPTPPACGGFAWTCGCDGQAYTNACSVIEAGQTIGPAFNPSTGCQTGGGTMGAVCSTHTQCGVNGFCQANTCASGGTAVGRCVLFDTSTCEPPNGQICDCARRVYFSACDARNQAALVVDCGLIGGR